jgi:DNA primase
LTTHIRLAFDSDKAGVAATERAIPISQIVGVELSIITLPDDAKDPDELIQHDPKLWQQAIDTSQPVVDWVIERFAEREDLTSAAGKRAFTTAAMNVIRSLSDPVEQDHYLSQIAKMTEASREALDRKMSVVTGSDVQPKKAVKQQQAQSQQPQEQQAPDKNQDALLAVALNDVHIQDLFRDIDPNIFVGNDRRAVVKYILANLGKSLDVIPDGLQSHEKYVTMLLLHPDVENVAWSKDNRVETATNVLRSLQSNFQKTNTKENLLRQEAEARERGDDAAAAEILRQLSILIKGEK